MNKWNIFHSSSQYSIRVVAVKSNSPVETVMVIIYQEKVHFYLNLKKGKKWKYAHSKSTESQRKHG